MLNICPEVSTKLVSEINIQEAGSYEFTFHTPSDHPTCSFFYASLNGDQLDPNGGCNNDVGSSDDQGSTSLYIHPHRMALHGVHIQ